MSKSDAACARWRAPMNCYRLQAISEDLRSIVTAHCSACIGDGQGPCVLEAAEDVLPAEVRESWHCFLAAGGTRH